MLKLSRMELAGFKSFYQRTELTFPEGITAVVGPNGCGKSNISDAISWVLGEQSSKSLRGARMEDVIFYGTAQRGPLPMAEVTLTLIWRGALDSATGSVAGKSPTADGNGSRSPGGSNGSPAGGDGLEVSAGPGPGGNGGGNGTPDADQSAGNGSEPSGIFQIPTEDGATVKVTRRLYRNGDSEYRINDTRCRLRDIRDLLQAASIGARTYAVIEQDRIRMLLAARPKERKELIEEAAGILGFKTRKRTALLKLESAAANLARLRDLIAEVKRQVNSLKRQASKARRFQRNAEEIRKRRRIVFHLEHAELAQGMQELTRQRDAQQAGVAAAESASAREEAQVEALRQRIDEEGRSAGEQREGLHGRQRELDRLDGELGALTERIVDAEAQSRRHGDEADDLRSRQTEAAEESEETAARRDTAGGKLAEEEAALARLQERNSGMLAAADEASSRAEDDRKRLLSAVAQVGEAGNRATQLEERRSRLIRQRQRLEKERTDCRSESRKIGVDQEAVLRRLESEAGELQEKEQACEAATDLCRRREGEAEAAREKLAASRRELHRWEERQRALEALWRPAPASDSPPVGEPAAAGVEVASEWEHAAGAGLAGLVRAQVVDEVASALEALEARKGSGSRLQLICRELTRPSGVSDGRLSGALTGDGAQLLAAAAGDPELVEDLSAAVGRWQDEPGRAYLTRTGESISPTGILAGAGSGEEAGLLAGNRRRREAVEKAAACAEILPQLEEAERAVRAACEAAVFDLDAARRRREAGAQGVLEARLLQERFAQEETRAGRRMAVLTDEESALQGEEAELEEELREARAKQAQAESAGEEASRASEASQARLDGLREQVESHSSERAELLSSCAGQREALRGLEESAARLRAAAEEFGRQATRRTAEAEKLAVHAEEQRAQQQELQGRRERIAGEVARLAEGCRADEMTLQESRAALAGTEEVARRARKAMDEVRQELQDKELERARAAADSDHLERECSEQFGCSPDALVLQLDEEELSCPAEEVRAALTRLEEIRERIGPVNMMALEQYAEVEERQDYLLSQQADLEESIRSLNATIQKINRTSTERFLYALNRIRGEFHRIFTELFSGGRADIVLEDPEDVLESGIEIIAQPPGKRTQNINLLSGGEKALSAIALLFAIFNYRPSPFCLLDEVDAPLDEANIDRFTRLLRDYGKETQFILITHNRRSMEIANAMYGITMAEPGVSQTVSVRLE